MSEFKNPYVRKREIEKELEILQVDEKHFKKYPPKPREWKKQREKDEVERKIFFLVIEKMTIDSCIKYFEKEMKIKREIDENKN